ncbi:MAG: cellulose biosynthesis cyclic di-GMP-binding regulatory protein BcsB [Bacteroidota bacterium]
MSRLRIHLACAVLFACFLAFAVSPQRAHAQDLTFDALGYPQGVELMGLTASQDLFIPVNAGLVPEAVVLELIPTPNLPEGYFSISSGDRIQSRVALPRGETQITVPLRDVRISDGKLQLTLEMVVEGDDYCEAFFLHRLYINPESVVRYSGTQQAAAEVSTFFPGFLDRVTYVMPEASADAAQAALWLAAYLARTYEAAPPELTVTTSPAGAPGAFERVVQWGGQGATLSNGGTTLNVGDLATARQLFQTEVGTRLAVSSSVRTQSVERSTPLFGEGAVTFADLGFETRNIEGAGTISSFYNFSLADFGADRIPAGVQLNIKHTPVPVGGNGYMHAYLNGSLIQSAPLDANELDVWAPIRPDVLQRDNNLEVRFAYNSPEGNCVRSVIPLSASIQTNSTFTLVSGEGVPDGLLRFPQVFADGFSVFVDPLNPTTLENAAHLVMAMQATTKTLLGPTMVGSTTGVEDLLAVGEHGLADALGATLAPSGTLQYNQLGTSITYAQDGAYAVLQGFENLTRDILLLTSSDAASNQAGDLLDEVLQPDGWYSAQGQLAVRGENGRAQVIDLDDPDQVAELGAPLRGFWAEYQWLIWLIVALLVLLLIIWIFPRVVRRQEEYPQYERLSGLEDEDPNVVQRPYRPAPRS